MEEGRKREILNDKEPSQTRKYKRIDTEGGLLTVDQEIDNYITTQHYEIRNNYMLGNYNKDGNYYIEEGILTSLVKIPKVKLSQYENTQFLTSTTAFEYKGLLQFCVVTTKKDGNATATLKLMEPVNKINGYIQNTNSFAVAFFTDDDNAEFAGKMEKVFNIYDHSDVKSDDADIQAIINRILYLRSQQLALGELFAEAEKDYYENRLEILQRPEYANVLKTYRELLVKAGVFLDEKDPNYYTSLNELLDQAIDITFNKNPELKQTYMDDVKEIDSKHNETITQIEQNTELVNAKMAELTAQEERTIVAPNKEAKKGGASKSKGGKSSGGKSSGGKSSGDGGGGKSNNGKSNDGKKVAPQKQNSEILSDRTLVEEELDNTGIEDTLEGFCNINFAELRKMQKTAMETKQATQQTTQQQTMEAKVKTQENSREM